MFCLMVREKKKEQNIFLSFWVRVSSMEEKVELEVVLKIQGILDKDEQRLSDPNLDLNPPE